MSRAVLRESVTCCQMNKEGFDPNRCSVLFLCQEQSYASGNRTTVDRIKGLLESRDSQCSVEDPRTVNEGFWKRKPKNCRVFAIHAWHCASALEACSLPYVIIFGGTDLNEYAKDRLCLHKMTLVVEKATFLITFGDSMTTRVKELWSNLHPSVLKQIPQSVTIDPSQYELKDHLGEEICISNIFLLVASIRPVKDPLFLVPAFSKWHRTHPSNILVIVGDKKDEGFYDRVEKCINQHEGVILFPKLPHRDVLACIRSSFALVNSSESEGMSAAILEAMELGTPVIARDIPGNRDLITNNVTGFLYKTPEEFISVVEMLIKTRDLKLGVVRNAREMVTDRHSCKSEKEEYLNILRHLTLIHN